MAANKTKAKGVTPEIIGEATPRSLAYFIVGSFLAFFLLNHAASLYLRVNGTNLGYRMIEAKWDMLYEMDEPVDWLVLGDSSCAHGFVPESWNEVMGGKSVNLGTIANLLLSNDAWMLEKYIEKFGAPEKVLLVHVADIWHRGYRSSLIGKVPEPWGFWGTREAKIDLTTEQEWKVWLSRYVPTYAENKTLSAHLLNFGPTKDFDLGMGSAGFIPGKEHDSRRLRRDLSKTLKTVRKTKNMRISKGNRAALNALGRLSSEYEFDIYLAHGSLYEKLRNDRAFSRFYDKQLQNIRKITNKYPRLHVVPTVLDYPKDKMEATVDHVHPAAAPGYTVDLAHLVKEFIELKGKSKGQEIKTPRPGKIRSLSPR